MCVGLIKGSVCIPQRAPTHKSYALIFDKLHLVILVLITSLLAIQAYVLGTGLAQVMLVFARVVKEGRVGTAMVTVQPTNTLHVQVTEPLSLTENLGPCFI